MKLNGALEPHHGAPPEFGCSIGVQKYRDKICDIDYNCQCNCTAKNVHLKRMLQHSYNSSNSNNNNNNHFSCSNKLYLEKQLELSAANNKQQQQLQQPTNVNYSDFKSISKLLLNNNTAITTAKRQQLRTTETPASACNQHNCLIAANCIANIVLRMLRVPQTLNWRPLDANMSSSRCLKLLLCVFIVAIALLPVPVLGDENDFFAVNSFSVGPETTTPEFDYASRGQKKFGDKCESTLECGFPGSICDPKKKSCQCTEDLPVTNHIDKCGKEAAVNESCFFNEQCEMKYFQTECRDGRCVCRFEMIPFWGKDGSVECKAGRQDKKGPETYVDPAMIGVLVAMAVMFIIICVVLRLFSQARWRENRTIFNTPNPRLMNVSLLRDSKLLHGQERRGSRMSVRAPSRQPSMASLRPHSPNPSLGKTGSRSGSQASGSNVSATSVRSTRSNSVSPANVVINAGNHHERKGSAHRNSQHHQHQQQQQQQPLMTNITANPTADSVTVEVLEPEEK